MKITKPVLAFTLLIALTTLQAFGQLEKIEIYKGDKFTLEYPSVWTNTNENGILNFFPRGNYGAVTFSSHSNIDFPLEKTKDYILDMYERKDKTENIKMTINGDLTEFHYEFVDQNVKWVTRAFRKGTDFYLLTINCDLDKWDANRTVFLKVANSLKLN